jgi:hypothetical protein
MLLCGPRRLVVRLSKVIGSASLKLRKDHSKERSGIKFGFNPLAPNVSGNRGHGADDKKTRQNERFQPRHHATFGFSDLK